jgi:hypothetical protein
MALSPDTQAKVDRLGKNQKHVLDSLARSNYPGGGWIWSNHSGTVAICKSLVRRGLVTTREIRGVTVAANYTVYEAIPEIVADYADRQAESARRRGEERMRQQAAADQRAREQRALKAATETLVARHRLEFEEILADKYADHGVAQSV